MVKNVRFEIEAYYSLFQLRPRQITSIVVRPKAMNEIGRRALIFASQDSALSSKDLQDLLDFQVFSLENISERPGVS